VGAGLTPSSLLPAAVRNAACSAWTSAIDACGRSDVQRWQRAMGLLTEMRDSGVVLDVRVYMSAIRCELRC
jgi:pentatricopeptide repeat protein